MNCKLIFQTQFFNATRSEWHKRFEYLNALGSIDISCRIEYDEDINSYFCKQMCETDRYFKNTSGDDYLDWNHFISSKIDAYRERRFICTTRHQLHTCAMYAGYSLQLCIRRWAAGLERNQFETLWRAKSRFELINKSGNLQRYRINREQVQKTGHKAHTWKKKFCALVCWFHNLFWVGLPVNLNISF